MTKLRALLVAVTLLTTAFAPVVGQALGTGALGNPLAFAAPASGVVSDNGNSNNNNSNSNNNNANDNGDNNNNGNDNNDGSGNNNNGNDNSNNNNSNGNSNNNNGNDNGDNNNNGNDNDDGGMPPAVSGPAPAPAPTCSTPGSESTFQSGDGRVQVKVFASMSQSVKFSIRLPIDQASVPTAPGPVVGGLLFQLMAEGCAGGPIPTLPAEVNISVRYADADVGSLNEANFTLARLDTGANQWRPSAKQAADPGSNLTSATITEMGYYVLYQK